MAETSSARPDMTEYVAGKWEHLERGDALAPPPEREADPLDDVVAGVITALQASTRLFPDSYAWIITDAVREQGAKPASDAELEFVRAATEGHRMSRAQDVWACACGWLAPEQGFAPPLRHAGQNALERHFIDVRLTALRDHRAHQGRKELTWE